MSATGRTESNCLPLVLLAGTLCDARVFAPMLRHAALAGRPVVHCDMTGVASARGLAERALSQVSGRFIPVGFSLGAIVALEMAVLAPERIAAMALIAANGRDVPEADHAARRAAAATDPGVLVGEVLWERSVAAGARHDSALKATIVAMAQSQPPCTLALQTEVALTRSDRRPLLPAMRMPALVLGGAEDRIAPPELQRELAEGLPDAELVIAPDAGHFLPLECPDLCARTLADWLAHVRTLA
ncbi:alpha/beta hydrolase [Novosphingobium resinovorum]|uniref:alpha/beta fold hydrolase n=1 Tax=Novosphingobium resinovorum TaxID=158500 RepID=UPI002ED5811A|nr:alpha/beta hydrolase [Novosphingobium resinovorum]